MDMGMHIIQEMNQRMKLEQTLEQRLEMQMKQEMTLNQYLKQEDLTNYLITWATDNNAWTEFNKDGFNFQFAKVPYKLAKPIVDESGPGFAHCQYNYWEALFNGIKIAKAKGDWTIFTVQDMFPEKISDSTQENIALHERGEELSLGDHYFASQLEFAYASKNRKTKEHIKFVDKNYPQKFVDLTQKVLFPILPEELIEFLKNKQVKEPELQTAQRLIEKNPIPTSVLQKMCKYHCWTSMLYSAIKDIAGPLQYEISTAPEYENKNQLIERVNNYLNKEFKTINPDWIKVTSPYRLKERWDNLTKNTDQTFYRKTIEQSHLDFPRTFHDAYRMFKDNKPIAGIR